MSKHIRGIPRELLAAVLGNANVVDWVAESVTDETKFVWRSLSQDDLEGFMQVSVGAGGNKLDMQSTQVKINRRCMFTSMMLDSANLVAQPVSRKSRYAADDKSWVAKWNTSERMRPLLGNFTAGEKQIEKKAAKSVEGKLMF